MGFLPKKGASQYLPKVKKEKSENKPTKNDKTYHNVRWRRYSILFRKKNPFCAHCGRYADHVDHIVPLSQGGAMWDEKNHQSLCIKCHGKKTAKDNYKKK